MDKFDNTCPICSENSDCGQGNAADERCGRGALARSNPIAQARSANRCKGRSVTLGQRLRKAREDAGMTQAELAHAAGLNDRRDVHKIEARTKQPKTLDTIEKLAKALGTTPGRLAFGDDGE